MTRHYCDECGEELRPWEGDRLKTERGRLKVEIITGVVGGAMNMGNWCHDCIRAAIASTATTKE